VAYSTCYWNHNTYFAAAAACCCWLCCCCCCSWWCCDSCGLRTVLYSLLAINVFFGWRFLGVFAGLGGGLTSSCNWAIQKEIHWLIESINLIFNIWNRVLGHSTWEYHLENFNCNFNFNLKQRTRQTNTSHFIQFQRHVTVSNWPQDFAQIQIIQQTICNEIINEIKTKAASKNNN